MFKKAYKYFVNTLSKLKKKERKKKFKAKQCMLWAPNVRRENFKQLLVVMVMTFRRSGEGGGVKPKYYNWLHLIQGGGGSVMLSNI